MAGPLARTPLHRTEREFGLVVGGVLAAFGGWWLFRDKFESIASVLLGIGIVLMLLGLAAPRALVLPSRAWMAFSEVLSVIMTRLILAIVFFLLVLPIGAVKRLTGWDPLGRRSKSGGSYWLPFAAQQRGPKHYENLF